MAEFVKLIGTIGENADKLGTVGTLLLGFIVFVYAINKDKLITGNRWKERITADAEEIQETKEALKTALAELSAVKEALLRLQVERDLLWSNEPPRQARGRRAAQQ